MDDFSVDYSTINVSDIADIHNYFMEKFSFRGSKSFRRSLSSRGSFKFQKIISLRSKCF